MRKDTRRDLTVEGGFRTAGNPPVVARLGPPIPRRPLAFPCLQSAGAEGGPSGAELLASTGDIAPWGLGRFAGPLGIPEEPAEVASDCWANATSLSAVSLEINAERPHKVQVVVYFVPIGSTGMKKSVKNLRSRVIAWAAGVWQKLHMVKMMANREAMRLNPKMINMPRTPPERAAEFDALTPLGRPWRNGRLIRV
jgi:hypothetical protein